MYSVMWSEHCSYKSSQGAPAHFGETTPEDATALLAGIGENAGVVDIGDGWAVTFKIESHNHPSLRRAVPGRGHRGRRHRPRHPGHGRPPGRGDGPAAVRPGRRRRTPSGCCPASSPASAATATPSACPTSAARSCSTPRYAGQPAGQRAAASGCCGTTDLHLAHASGAGNQVILYGARHRRRRHRRGLRAGVSEPSTTRSRASGPAVQVGDPFMEKVLIECTLEVFAAGLVVGIQDLGGAGLSCATSELAVRRRRRDARRARPGAAARRRAAPGEILISESQERMWRSSRPTRSTRSWPSARSGTCRPPSSARSTDGEPADHRLARRDRSSTSRRGPSPTKARSTTRPSRARRGRTRCRPTTAEPLPRPATGDELGETLLRMVASPNLCVEVVGHRPVRPLRPRQHGARPARGRRHPPGRRGDRPRRRAGHRLQRPVHQARPVRRAPSSRWPRPTATSPPPAPTPLAITDCLNFGSPEDPAVMWQFAEAIRGLADGCLELGHPGHRRQRQLLQPDRRRRDPADPGGRRARRHRRRPAAGRRSASRADGRRCCCSARPATSSTARRGPTSCTATSAGCRRRSTWRPRSRSVR